MVNKLKGILQVCAVKAPGYGDRRKAMLEDIATLTGGKAIFKDLGIQLENVQLKDLGRAKKVKIDAENTTITEGAGDKKAVEGRCEMIRREIGVTDSEYDREKLQERLAKLAGGVAQLKVGAATETEMKERKALYEDALHATRAAIAEGIVPGGGVALLQARKVLDKFELTGDEGLGVRCLRNVLEIPCRMIAENAGLDGSVVVNTIRKSKEKNYGYDALKASLRRHAQGRHRRPGEGHPQRPAKRGQRRLPAADHRIAGRRHSREGQEGRPPRRPPRRRHGWNGRHGRDGRHGWNGWHGRHGNGM